MVILKREALEEMTEPQIESKAKKAKEVAHPEVKIPSYVGQSVTSILVFIMAATMRGKWAPFCIRKKGENSMWPFFSLVKKFGKIEN